MNRSDRCCARGDHGFTLVELLVVLAIVALMLTIAAPRYIDHVDRARESALKASLMTLRQTIDQFAGDTGRAPRSLDELVERRYLREVPIDPFTDRRDTWVMIPAADARTAAGAWPDDDGVIDVRSGAEGSTRDGTALGEL